MTECPVETLQKSYSVSTGMHGGVDSWQPSEEERSRSVLVVPQSQKSQVVPRRQAIWPRKSFMGVYVWQ